MTFEVAHRGTPDECRMGARPAVGCPRTRAGCPPACPLERPLAAARPWAHRQARSRRSLPHQWRGWADSDRAGARSPGLSPLVLVPPSGGLVGDRTTTRTEAL